MSTASLLRHIDHDDRSRARVAAGTRAPKTIADPHVHYLGCAIRYRFETKRPGAPIPTGCVVLAARRNEHGQYPTVLVEAFEGDGAAFASFPRLALMLGATELWICQPPAPGQRRPAADALDRRHVVAEIARGAAADRATLLSRPLAPAGAYDRSAIMATACAVAKGRQALTGEAWGACLSVALRGVWVLAKAARTAAIKARPAPEPIAEPPVPTAFNVIIHSEIEVHPVMRGHNREIWTGTEAEAVAFAAKLEALPKCPGPWAATYSVAPDCSAR